MIEVLRAYLQIASGVGELTRQRALDVARQALAGTPAAVVLPVASAGVEGLTAQASALADELMAASRQNRELLTQLVRSEVDTVLTRLGLGGSGGAELEAELAVSRARVHELERQLAAGASVRVAVRERATAKRIPAKRATAKRTPAERTPAERTPAERAPAQRTPSERTPAERAPAERTPAERAPAERTPAERPTTGTTAKQGTKGTAAKRSPTKATAAGTAPAPA